ncbi:MAG TPA: hypothetical protein VGQ24_06070 [Gemmatimonadales bacterium]|nr:hypothetical protein [Gemmatimonadales bacterium]
MTIPTSNGRLPTARWLPSELRADLQGYVVYLRVPAGAPDLDLRSGTILANEEA